MSFLSEPDLFIVILVLAVVAAFIFLLNGLLDIAFFVVTGSAVILGLWVLAMNSPVGAHIVLPVGVLISVVVFLWAA